MFSHQIDSIKSSVIGLVLILGTAIIGLGWIGYGLFSLFVLYLGPVWGPLALGGLFMLPLIIYLLAKLLPHNAKKRKQQAYSEAFANSSVGAISTMVDSMSAHSPIAATLVAVIGGFMVSRFPQFLPMFAEIVHALGEELARRKVKKAEKTEREARADYERAAAAPPPPDVEPIKRRNRKTADMY